MFEASARLRRRTLPCAPLPKGLRIREMLEARAAWEGNKAIQFRCLVGYLRFDMVLSDLPAKESHTYKEACTFQRAKGLPEKLWEQPCGQQWRALALMIKAKLEGIESGIVTFEEEFLPHILLPEGGTGYEHINGRVATACDTGKMPPLLPGTGG